MSFFKTIFSLQKRPYSSSTIYPVALVTGGGRGIGKNIVKYLLLKKYRVAGLFFHLP